MNIQQLRQSLKIKWLSYYNENRPWLVKMQVWGTYDGERRPSSGFILATLSVLEPQLDEIFPFILDLNNNPDRIVAALGLNFNPDQDLDLVKSENLIDTTQVISLSQPLKSDAIKNEVETNIQPEALAMTAEVKNHELERSPVFSGKVENKRKSKPLGFATHTSNNSHTKGRNNRILPGDAIRMNATSSELKAGVTALLPSNVKNQRAIAPLTKPDQDKLVKTQRKHVPGEVNLSPTTKASTLASWMDEFCEGAD